MPLSKIYLKALLMTSAAVPHTALAWTSFNLNVETAVALDHCYLLSAACCLLAADGCLLFLV
jgi:hypothetical protein